MTEDVQHLYTYASSYRSHVPCNPVISHPVLSFHFPDCPLYHNTGLLRKANLRALRAEYNVLALQEDIALQDMISRRS